MWPFNTKTTLEKCGLLQDFTDWHCHLLPGVDDGVHEMEETLEILTEYENQGVKEVWLTPHVMEDVPNAPEALKERFEELKKNYRGRISLHLGAENMLDNLFDTRLSQGAILPIGSTGRHLLVETSYFTPPFDLYDKIDRLKAAGYFPLLAHPERYVYMTDTDYEKLLGLGVKFQLNLYSLLGMYGPEVQRKARAMLKNGKYSAVGTDTHRYRQLRYGLRHAKLKKSEARMVREIIENTSL